MKKRKFNILLNIAVLCMCVCAIAIGVYSAKTASLNVSGTIGFQAHNCKVRVLGKITGAVDASNNAITSNTETATINYTDSSDTSKGKLINGNAEPWNFGSIFFDDLNTDKYHEVNDIVFTFTITNESAYYVDVTVNQDCINDNRIFIYAPNNGETLAPKDQTGSSVTLTVKLQLQKVNGEYSSLDHAISLSNATLLNFTKSQAPSYLATDWKSKITGISSATSISFVKEIDESIKSDSSYTQIKVGAENATSVQSDLTNNKNVTDIIAYYNSTNKEVIVYSPARIYAPERCSSMFDFYDKLTNLDVSNFDTSKVKAMDSMFNECSLLTNLNVSDFDTSNVTSMSFMFMKCLVLKNLDVRNFDTGNVTKMNFLFCNCKALISLDVSNFDTSKVTNMDTMFNGCNDITSLDVSNFDTSSVTNMGSIFSGCSKLTNLDVINFNTSKVTNMGGMFSSCGVTSLDLSNFDTSSVTNMGSMFSGCSKLTNLDVINFNTSKVTNMIRMFSSCMALASLDISNFDTSKVTNMGGMFSSCGVTSLDLSNFDTSSVTDMYSMFDGCKALTSLDVSNFNTSKVTDMCFMFRNCVVLTSLDLRNFDTSNASNMYTMFSGCSGLTSLNISSFVITKADSLNEMFANCSKLTYLDLSNFNTGNVTNMKEMFFNCSKLEKIEVSTNWSIAKLGQYYKKADTFTGCTSLNQNSSVAMKYDSSKTTADYAKTGTNGYLTLKSN